VSSSPRQRALYLGIAALALAAVAAALVTQHGFDMQPCPWCVLQRLIFLSIALVALLAAAWPTAGIGVLLLGLSGIAAALWQHFVASASGSCNQTLADRIVSGLGLDGLLPEVFQARANCADAAVELLGLRYELWSFALFVLLVAIGGRAMVRR
jgi:protein dithiol:quinone oxidoreductase